MAERSFGSLLDCPVKFPLEASPALAQSLRLPTPQRKLAAVTLSGSGTVKGEGYARGQGFRERGSAVKEPGLRVASGFKQLCLEIEENLSERGRTLAGLPGLRHVKFLPTCDGSGRFVGREEGQGHRGSGHNPEAFFLVKNPVLK